MNRRGMLLFVLLNVIISVGVAVIAIVLWQQSQPATPQAVALDDPSGSANGEPSGSFPVIITSTPGPTQTPWIVTATPLPGSQGQATAPATADLGGVATVAPTLDSTAVLLTLAANTGQDLSAEGASADAVTDDTGDTETDSAESAASSAAATGEIYVVQDGDSPALIAESLGINVLDLLCANNLGTLEEPEFIFPGDELIIPGANFVCEETLEPTATETLELSVDDTGDAEAVVTSVLPTVDQSLLAGAVQPTATLAPTAADAQVVIVRVLNAGNLATEAIELRNMAGLIDLNGWTLYDTEGNVFTFPAYRLFANAGVTIFSRAGTNTPVALFWNESQALWQDGDMLMLADANGEVQSAFVVGVSDAPTAPPATPQPQG